MTLPAGLREELRAAVGDAHVLVDPELRRPYEVDWTGRFDGTAPAVVRPADTAEVAAVLAACARHGVTVVPQGGNTGLVGGSVPLHGELVVSLRRLDALEPVDAEAAQVTVGAGVTLATLQRHAAASGFAMLVDLAARDSATVGGMVATNAGGSHAFRHGSMRAQLAGIEAVLADGRVVRHLRGLLKDNTGYDLASLLAGSEGTLGVITRARIRLGAPRPHRATALVALDDLGAAVDAVAALRDRLPSLEAAELMTGDGLALVCDHLAVEAPFATHHRAYLLLECAAPDVDPTDALAAAIAAPDLRIAAEAVALEPAGRERLWRYREAHTEAVAALGVPTKLDVALPLAALATFLDRVPGAVRAVAPDARIVLFGHAGDGNVHVNVLDDGATPERVEAVCDAVLGLTVELGGSISAEHGIGTAKASWLPRDRSAVELAVFRALRRALDPAAMLNPHVLVPPS